MPEAHPEAIFLKDYTKPGFLIDHTDLRFELHEDHAIVESQLQLRRNTGADDSPDLILQGESLELLSLAIDGQALEASDYRVAESTLTIRSVPSAFTLSCRTRLRPQDNTSLEGLYKSRSMFCTQCEAEGFRKITYYLDRPDVMSTFSVTVEADESRYPVLLSNGNPVEREDAGDGRHSVRWHDPFPKPSYLFALVAGDLRAVEDRFTTTSGRVVELAIYVEEKDLDKCDHAMQSLKRAMAWDEKVYGREYDLDVFNIVAVDDFNMGAMENKGLNIFNTNCVLANRATATDAEFQRVEAVVAHEYFHNWSGNRVTCRDWFQLSLKEGFTVFREQQFCADMGSPVVARIEDATVLRTAQFAEDAGPMAHPVRPDSYIEISNFYTATVYLKGAEVVRMLHTLLGPEAFRRGTDLYFERHDGQAVTCEDFVLALEEASGRDLQQFRRWYSQAGTPRLVVRDDYDAAHRCYTLHVEQVCPATPGQSEKEPCVIPLTLGLLGAEGNLPLYPEDASSVAGPEAREAVLVVNRPVQEFVFHDVAERPVPSLLRHFSAPVRVDYAYTPEQLAALMSGDGDGFVRWDAMQQLALAVLRDLQHQPPEQATVDIELLQAYGRLLRDDTRDPAELATMLQLPDEDYLAELAGERGEADPDAIHRSRETVLDALAREHGALVLQRYHNLAGDASGGIESRAIAARALRNGCLSLLARAGREGVNLAREQFDTADNMTDTLAAFRSLVHHGDEKQARDALEAFHQHWRHETLVINHWFGIQATATSSGTPERIRELMSHPDFDLRNPNRVRALIGGFSARNPVNFHRADGAGYGLLGEVVMELDRMNPQIAARLLTPLTRWRRYRDRGETMRGELERLAATADLSPDVYEVVTKSLA